MNSVSIYTFNVDNLVKEQIDDVIPWLQDTVWQGWALPVNHAGRLLHIDLYAKDVLAFGRAYLELCQIGGQPTGPRAVPEQTGSPAGASATGGAQQGSGDAELLHHWIPQWRRRGSCDVWVSAEGFFYVLSYQSAHAGSSAQLQQPDLDLAGFELMFVPK